MYHHIDTPTVQNAAPLQYSYTVHLPVCLLFKNERSSTFRLLSLMRERSLEVEQGHMGPGHIMTLWMSEREARSWQPQVVQELF